MPVSIEVKNAARAMFLRGVNVNEIAQETGVTTRSIYAWAKQQGWNKQQTALSAQTIVMQRLCLLADRDNKTPAEIKEFESLCRQTAMFEQNSAKTQKIIAEANRIQAEADCISQHGAYPTKGSGGKKRQGKRNDISDIDVNKFDEVARQLFYKYQHTWRNNQHHRSRFILKSRQIGATFYFAWEAFEDAVKRGRNKIFLSASKSQARVFRGYIIAFSLEYFDLELKGGDQIELFKDGKLHCTLYFLSTNATTAQSYSGDLYVDEIFWIPQVVKLLRLAKGMASHKKWRITYFSTPSSIQHGAYAIWQGKAYNDKKANAKHPIKIETFTKQQLLDGILCADNIWRCRVDVVQAQQLGCDLFAIDELRDDNTKDDFDNLYLCQFLDDRMSVFPFSALQPCMADTAAWVHIKDTNRPLGNRPVAVGYDPSRIRDNAALTLLEVPMTSRQKWRLFEKQQYQGMSSEYQANRIRETLQRFNVVHIGIDITGIGYGVFEQIEDLEQVMPIYYSVETKTRLIMNTKRIIEGGLFEYDAADTAITQSFMQITQMTTANGSITYGASRSADTGHADIAWSAMHGMFYQQYNEYTTSQENGGFYMPS